jgi:hypothetical protein
LGEGRGTADPTQECIGDWGRKEEEELVMEDGTTDEGGNWAKLGESENKEPEG